MQLNGTSLCILTFVTVWLVTRIHRAHQRAVLAAFVVALLAPRLPEIVRLVVDAASHSNLASALAPAIVPTALQAVITLAAGLWVIRKNRFAEMDGRTRVVVISVAAQAVITALIYRARLVGVLPYSRPEWHFLDALDIGGVAYLVRILWDPSRTLRNPKHPESLTNVDRSEGEHCL